MFSYIKIIITFLWGQKPQIMDIKVYNEKINKCK
jgi:hypothetical protein